MPLPRRPEVVRSVEIAALPVAQVFALVADLRHLPEWLPRFAADPDVAITFTGPIDGVGQKLNWKAGWRQVGSGSETVTSIEPERHVEMAVIVAGKGGDDGAVRRRGDGATETRVDWGFRTDLGLNPVGALFGGCRSTGRSGRTTSAASCGSRLSPRRLRSRASAPPRRSPRDRGHASRRDACRR